MTYFLSVGVRGPIMYSALLFMAILVLVAETKKDLLFPVFILIISIGFFIFEYNNPNYFEFVLSGQSEIFVRMSNFLLVSFTLFFISSTAQLHLIDSQKNLFEISVTDELTQLYNRRYLIKVLETVQSQSNRKGTDFYLLFIDINKFKYINDTFGHKTGDKILIILGKVIRESIRNYDIGGRYGGDEFIILLPHTNYEEAIEISKRLNDKFQLEVSKFTDEKVSLAIGVTSGLNKDIENIIHEADEKMYEHKRENR
jgi:diguanylate cyclase (GGDEF)-like protein